MTNPMLAELDEVVRLMEAATEGEWGSWHLPASGTSGDAFGHLIGPPIRYRDRSQGFTPDDAHLIARSVNFLRTHHATLADMAKRLEAVERDAARWRKLMQWHDAPQGRKHATVMFWADEPYEPENSLALVNAMNKAIDATQEGEAD